MSVGHATDNGSGGDGRWLSKAELGQLRGISPASADRLARRNGWRRTHGNDKRTRILVPGPFLNSSYDIPTPRPPEKPERPPPEVEVAPLIAVLDAALAALREQLDRERSRADRAEAREAELRQSLDALMQVNSSRKAKRRWARLKMAWRGE